MRFESVILIGAGTIACDCSRTLSRLAPGRLHIIESAQARLSMLRHVAIKQGAPYELLTDRAAIYQRLTEFAKHGATLIISANNGYVFPRDLIDREQVEIINFHYSYLPRYRGINIPTWTIYNDEPYTGVTWHFVEPEIDHGKIIAQEKILIRKDTRAIDIVRQGMTLARQLFDGFIGGFLAHPMEGRAVVYPPDEPLYVSSRLPGDGILDLSQPLEAIDRHLRSFDYGCPSIFTPLQIVWEGKTYDVQSYTRPMATDSGDRVTKDGDVFTIVRNGKCMKVCVRSVLQKLAPYGA